MVGVASNRFHGAGRPVEDGLEALADRQVGVAGFDGKLIDCF